MHILNNMPQVHHCVSEERYAVGCTNTPKKMSAIDSSVKLRKYENLSNRQVFQKTQTECLVE